MNALGGFSEILPLAMAWPWSQENPPFGHRSRQRHRRFAPPHPAGARPNGGCRVGTPGARDAGIRAGRGRQRRSLCDEEGWATGLVPM